MTRLNQQSIAGPESDAVKIETQTYTRTYTEPISSLSVDVP